jgi:hypothetical protein
LAELAAINVSSGQAIVRQREKESIHYLQYSSQMAAVRKKIRAERFRSDDHGKKICKIFRHPQSLLCYSISTLSAAFVGLSAGSGEV